MRRMPGDNFQPCAAASQRVQVSGSAFRPPRTPGMDRWRKTSETCRIAPFTYTGINPPLDWASDASLSTRLRTRLEYAIPDIPSWFCYMALAARKRRGPVLVCQPDCRQLIAENRIRPMLIVMPDGSGSPSSEPDRDPVSNADVVGKDLLRDGIRWWNLFTESSGVPRIPRHCGRIHGRLSSTRLRPAHRR
jgi:hypothetical protein